MIHTRGITYLPLILGFSVALMGCARMSGQRPIDVQQLLEFYQVSNSSAMPSITVRARRYVDRVELLAECFLLEGGTATSSATNDARDQCRTTLSRALDDFQSHNSWQLSGLRSKPTQWVSHVDENNTLVLTGAVRLTLQSH